MNLSSVSRRTTMALVVWGMAACGGAEDAADDAASAAGEAAPSAAAAADSPGAAYRMQAQDASVDEARARQTLLGAGLPTLVGRRKPEFAGLDFLRGRQLFERETFGGNGRTCLTCHSRATGTVSPSDAQHRFDKDPGDPLFVGDGSDDGQGHGVQRMLSDATVLVRVALPGNVSLANDPEARSVVLRRGIPSTLNTPALDDVLMLDGRQPNLLAQAHGAISDHAQATREPRRDQLQHIAAFEHTPAFFSSFPLLRFAYTGIRPELPEGRSDAQKRGRRFFVDAPPGGDLKTGLCAGCHSGPMLNETNEFIPAPPFKRGGRFQSIGVSEFNVAGNPVIDFVFRNPDGTTTMVSSPDPGRALITGDANDTAQSRNAFKIPSLWGAARTAPYFHDNSAKTLEDVARHCATFFGVVSPIVLTEQDQQDMVAYMRLLR